MTSKHCPPGTPSTVASFEENVSQSDSVTTTSDSNLNSNSNGNGNGNGNIATSDDKNDTNDHPIAFAKSQTALNKAYRQRRVQYNKTPLAARMETGKNLKNLQSLAVRNAEFC